MLTHTGTHDAGVVVHIMPLVLNANKLQAVFMTGDMDRATPALVKGGKFYPEGQTHVIPLLLQTLPGIDPNDIKKCMVSYSLFTWLRIKVKKLASISANYCLYLHKFSKVCNRKDHALHSKTWLLVLKFQGGTA